MDSRRTLRVLVVVSVLVLATLAAVLTLQAINANARISRLRQHGMPVDVTVTSCLGLASGTGITETGYRCRGTFTLDGHHHNEVIAGTTDLHPTGETLHAVTDPSDPAILSTADADGHVGPAHLQLGEPVGDLGGADVVEFEDRRVAVLDDERGSGKGGRARRGRSAGSR